MLEEISSWNNGLVTSPFTDPAWHNVYFETLGKNPLILIDRILNVIAPMETDGKTVFFSGGMEVSDYSDLIGNKNHFHTMWKQILDYVQKPLVLHNIPQDSPTLSFFPKETISKEDTTPIIHLPESVDAYMAILDRKNRHELNRKIRKFERENQNISISTSDGIDNLLSLMNLNEEKKTFLTEPMQKFFRGIAEALHEHSFFQVLTVSGTPVSVIWYFTYAKTVYLYNSGFDEANHPGAGFYLKAKHILWAIGNGYTEYNFLQGSERYKYELGGKDFIVYKIESPTPTTTTATSAAGGAAGKS